MTDFDSIKKELAEIVRENGKTAENILSGFSSQMVGMLESVSKNPNSALVIFFDPYAEHNSGVSVSVMEPSETGGNDVVRRNISVKEFLSIELKAVLWGLEKFHKFKFEDLFLNEMCKMLLDKNRQHEIKNACFVGRADDLRENTFLVCDYNEDEGGFDKLLEIISLNNILMMDSDFKAIVGE